MSMFEDRVSGVVAEAGYPAHAVRREGREAGPEAWDLHLSDVERQHLLAELTALTPREREVACAVCAGGANEVVADRLCIALPTLRTHLMRINQKLGTTRKSDLVGLVSSRLLDGYRRGKIPRQSVIEPKHNGGNGLSIRAALRNGVDGGEKSSFSMTTESPRSGQ